MSVHAYAGRQDPIREARIDLAAAFRLAARLGFDDTIWNHFTLTVPGRTDRFLSKPHGLLMSEIRASDIIVIDEEGNTVDGKGKSDRAAVCIHVGLHQAHPRARCVLHTHQKFGTWLGNIEGGRLLPINQNAIRFYNRVSYDEGYNGLGTSHEEGARIASTLGETNNILVMANHGLIVVGPTVGHAFYDLYYFEVSCEEQYMVACSGQTPRLIPQDICQMTYEQYQTDEKDAGIDYFAAMKRMLAREEPDFME